MAFNQILKGTLLPKISLQKLWDEDSSSGSGSPFFEMNINKPDSSQKVGANEPFVKIGNQVVTDIENLIIDETGIIPTITMIFNDSSGEYSGHVFPKHNIILNLYLKASNDNFKPIRNDFLITSIKSISNKKSDQAKHRWTETSHTYLVKGELYVPKLHNHISKAYVNLNSKDTLKRIAEDFKLGFSENESSTSDQMTWINPNNSTLNFIDEIIKHSYRDDDTFFTAFIDKYYYLNFIDVNEQLKITDADSTFIAHANGLEAGFSQKMKDSPEIQKLYQETVDNYLTTESKDKGQSNFIVDIDLISNQGAILNDHGYKKHLYYYDSQTNHESPKDKFKDFFLKPINSTGRSVDTFLIPEDKDLAENETRDWTGITYGNVHDNWKTANLLNEHNLNELEKIKLKVTINNINFQCIRGAMIPVVVTSNKAEYMMKAAELDTNLEAMITDKSNLMDETIDSQLTGYYYISGAKYYYDKTRSVGLYTELYLARREWNRSKIIK
jgi:hypothetical protein